MRIAVVGLVAVLALAACTTAPAPKPTLGPDTLCKTAYYTQTIEDPPDITATKLTELGFPFADLVDADIPVTCTAHFAVADGPEFDVALVNLPSAQLEGELETLLGTGWTRDPDAAATWRDDAEPGHRIQAIEIEEGVLVTRTDASS